MHRGEVVAFVRSLYGDVIDEVICPADGYVRTVLFSNQAVCSAAIVHSYLAKEPQESFFGVD